MKRPEPAGGVVYPGWDTLTEDTRGMPQLTALVVLGLGANLGDRRATLRAAVAVLAAAERTELVAVSDLWRTAPVGGPDQPDYLNAVAEVRTGLPPRELLTVCQAAEAAARRVREVHWGPRTLDVDIVSYEDVTSDDPALTLPHPRAHERAFVLAPWAQLDPDALLAAGGVTRPVRQWLELAADQKVQRLNAGRWWA